MATVEHGDPVGRHRLGDPLEVAGRGDAVGQDDHVLELGDRRSQRLVGFFHRRGHDGAAAGLEAGDPVEHKALVVAGVHLADPEVLALEGEHADLVAGPQELDGRPGRLLGHLDLLTAHRAGFVDHQHHRQAGLFLLFLEVAPDRQDLFEGRLVIAPQAERLIAAQHDQPAAQVLHVGARDLHLADGERRSRARLRE